MRNNNAVRFAKGIETIIRPGILLGAINHASPHGVWLDVAKMGQEILLGVKRYGLVSRYKDLSERSSLTL